jgi:dihydrofolate reductase
MSKLRVLSFGLTIDGYGAGPHQDLKNPLGVGGNVLLDWSRASHTWRARHGADGGDESGVDEEFGARGFRDIGAWIMGRNMFGPVRGPWPDQSWKGWWGDTPPFHTPVIVLTHHEHPPVETKGGTTFYFVTDGIEAALKKAVEGANGKDIRLGGGVATVRQYLKAGLVDEIHLAIIPTLLGTGEHLLSGIDLAKMGYRCVEYVPSARASHVVLRKQSA